MSLDAYILTASERHREQLRTKNLYLMRIRWFYVLIIGITGITLPAITKTNISSTSQQITFVSLFLLLNTILFYIVRRKDGIRSINFYRLVAVGQIMMDIVLASYTIYIRGGANSRTVILYAIPIITAGILFTSVVVYSAALLSAVAYITAVVAYHLIHNDTLSGAQLVSPIVFYPIVFFIIAAIVTKLSTLSAQTVEQKSYDELLAMLTHQLRHPSSTIAAIIDMLQSDPSFKNLSPQQKKMLGMIKNENSHSVNLISNLLEAARGESKLDSPLAKLEQVNIATLVRESADSCALGSHRAKDLRLNIPDAPVTSLGHTDQLRMALDNIINNAFLYSQAGTAVVIGIGLDPKNIKLQIIDHGRGMSQAQQRVLFQRFSDFSDDRFGNSPPKMGLGLYVSKRIIERHQGTLHVSSKVGQGTKITVNLKRG
ncbi:HAMP domain-containing histidine kinase [Candidatus Saccharibacteria bacterium]|nr:HAMP domain-containing histidine kinase [Candidatus Saccharibacteria bacterium]